MQYRLKRIGVVLLLSLASLASLAQAPPAADTYASSTKPNAANGTGTTLPVLSGTNSYVQFNLSTLPADASVNKATLRLFVDAATASGQFDVYQVNGAWSEATLTYNTRPLLGPSATGSLPITISKATNLNTFVVVDITPLVQSWVDGTTPNNGVALVLVGSAGSFSFDSKESGQTSHQPELEIVLNGPQGLPGPQGATGPQGPIGVDGSQGPAGASPFSLNGSTAYYTAGSVGIGTSSPGASLEVRGNDNTQFRIGRNTGPSQYMSLWFGTTDGVIDTIGAGFGLQILNNGQANTTFLNGGGQHVFGNVAATSFTGDGSGLTGITAASATNAAHANTADAAISANFATTAGAAGDSAALGGVAAGSYARLDVGNSFNGSQSVSGDLNVSRFASAINFSAENNQDITAGFFKNNANLGTNDAVLAVHTGRGPAVHGLSTQYGGRAGFFEATAPNNPNEQTNFNTIGLEAVSNGGGPALLAHSTGGGPAALFTTGNVGIGTSAPAQKLDVNGNMNASGNVNAASFTGDGSGLTNIAAASAGTAANALQLNGLPSSAYAQQATPNTFSGDQTVNGNVNIGGTGNGVVFPDGTKQTTASVVAVIPAGFMILGNTATAPSGFSPAGTITSGNTWVTVASMPTPRYSLGAAVLDGKIYAIGGRDANGQPLATVEVYDPGTNSWSTAAPLPTSRCCFAAAAANGKVYAIGGYDSNFIPLATVEAYDPVTNTWSAARAMSTARVFPAPSVVNDKIYAIGGWDSSGIPLATVEVYDPAANIWSAARSMPTARAGAGAVGLSGKVYAIGGGSTAVEVYDPVADAWGTAASLPAEEQFVTAVAVNGNIYALGSVGMGDLVEVLDTAANSWSTAAPLLLPRSDFSAAAVNGQLFALGGCCPKGLVEQYVPPVNFYVFRKN